MATAIVAILSVIAIFRRIRRAPFIRLGRFRVVSVYIFRDKGYPGIIKVGMTTKACMARKKQVSRTMAEGSELAQVYALDHVPFPRAVERLAHTMLARHRVWWPKGSKRGVEWFHAADAKAIERAIAAVERAARMVRTAARKKRRWPTDADARVSVWRLSGGRIQRYRLFAEEKRKVA
jgi:hypothetical protein